MDVMRIDLNCDMGESFGAYTVGRDEEMLAFITSANIACGFHAGDPDVMRRTVQLAVNHNIAIGAHPGFSDLAGFGRRDMALSADEVYTSVVYQIGALAAFVKAEEASLHHVKPHGALYNMAAERAEYAQAIAAAVKDVDSTLMLYGLAGSELIQAGKETGLKTASEVFADRTYTRFGTLTPRRQPNALITDPVRASAQVIRMIKENKVQATDGTDIEIEAETVCIHGDGEQAREFACIIHNKLKEAGIEVASL